MKNKRILIVENDADMLFLLEKAFIEAGYTVEGLKSGNSIVEKKHQVLPDLFVIDKNLATIDGLAVAKFLRLQKATRKVPIIMVSAYPVKNQARNAGVNEFIKKPFELNHLMEVVNGFLGKKHLREHRA